MEIILSKQCESLTGTLGKGFGYHIQHRKNGFFSKRNAKGDVPQDGHWRFIVSCAELAHIGLYLSDIKVSRVEVSDALKEARKFIALQNLCKATYNARDILNLKTTFGL